MTNNTDQVPIISVTGTKGKTTTVAVIADVLRALNHNVVKVDTTGHFVNGERRSSLDDSKQTWRLVPSVCPGRYLWEFHSHPELRENGVAVLECSLGCSALSGLGYRYHQVGVFLNVFEDHLGSSNRIQSREDIAKAKAFIFSKILPEGAAVVFNADDELVVKTLESDLLTEKNALKIAVGFEFAYIDKKSFLGSGGVTLTVNSDTQLVLETAKGSSVLANLKNIPWTFDGQFTPSLWNLLSAAGAIYGLYLGKMPEGFGMALESVRLDPYGGRLTLLQAANGALVLADYAHEKVSIEMVGNLARTKLKPGGKLYGVVRLAHDRTDTLMTETGKSIARAYDEFIVYEKIDGYWRKPVNNAKTKRFPQVVGRTSEIFADAIASVNPNVTRILREDKAIAEAAMRAREGDVVVIIVNDNIERSIGFIKDSFKAEFI